MSPKELKAKCREQIEIVGDAFEAEVLLIQPGHWGKRNHRKLLGVEGEIVQEYETTIAVMYPARKLLEAIESMEATDE